MNESTKQELVPEKCDSGCKIKEEDAIYIALTIGERILYCGGEVSRVEDTIKRICLAYGAKSVDVTVIMALVVFSVDFGNGTHTVSKRISGGDTNLARFSRLNNLSRRICVECPDRAEFDELYEKIENETKPNIFYHLFGCLLTAAAFAVFFGGNLLDFLLAGAIAIPMILALKLLSHFRLNNIVMKFIVSFLGGVLAIIVGRTGINCHTDMIMIGDIMNIIPGVALTNSIRDLFSGDIMSGVFRLFAAVLDAVAIAFGYAVAIIVFGGAL